MKFLDIREVIIIHKKMIEIRGERKGIKNYRLLHSAIEQPKPHLLTNPSILLYTLKQLT